jgi:ABC-2 type transport system permease protein
MTDKYKIKQLIQLFEVHAKELIREPAVLFWGFVFPILMAMGLGLAFTNKADVIINAAVIQSSATPKLDHFLQNNTETLTATSDTALRQRLIIENDKLGNTTFFFQRCSWQEALTLLKRGKLSILIEESNNQIKYHFDPLNPDAQISYMKLSALLNGQPVVTKQDNLDITPLTVSGSRYIDFLIPGLIALGVMMSCMWGISYGMIEKRSQKLLRRMVATPMKKSYFLMTLMTVRTILNFLESCALFLVAWLFFDITIQGNIVALLLIFLAGNISFAGIAILVSSHTAKTEVGNGLINAVVTPMMILSGIFFSYHNFPDGLVWIIRKLPLTILADGIRSIFIEGAGLAESILPIFILCTTGVLFFAAGLRIFKWH